ncbi:hypothetical protein COLO4_33374 [Corchorus olitorius]|uniref:Prolamin-like domain-containing protein n=1 Tax=Corchorus olitorius TaxID=93759 RepID=A0A1R3GUC3_9ROSI|nr:hypothetical protein COLO4_33374 [Corchorus olitorius]
MSRKSATTICMLLLLAILVQPGLSQFLLPPGSPIDVQKCFSSLMSIQGCMLEIFTSVFGGQFGKIGPQCCKAITDINDGCWPKLFPLLNPLTFLPMLKDNCGARSASASAAPSPK